MAGLNIPLILRKDVSANWTSVNPILLDGQEGWEKDTNKKKIGDGVTAWNDLDYFGGSSTAADTSFDPTTLFDPSITDVQAMGDELKTKVDAALTKTFTPWQPEVIEVVGNITSVDSDVDGAIVSSLNGDSASVIYATQTATSLTLCFSLNKATTNAKFYVDESWVGGSNWSNIAEVECQGDIVQFGASTNLGSVSIEQGDEVFLTYNQDPDSNILLVNGVEVASTSHLVSTSRHFRLTVVDTGNSPSFTLIETPTTNPLNSVIHYSTDKIIIDENSYPQNNLGRGYEVVDLSQPFQWDALGKEVKNGDFIVFDNAEIPKEVGAGEEVDLSEYTKRSADETITGEWDFQSEMKVGNYTYNTMFGPYPVEKIIATYPPNLSGPMIIAYGVDTGYSFSPMTVAFNVNDLWLGESIVTNLFTEESSITGGSTDVTSVTSKDSNGTVRKSLSFQALADGGVPVTIGVVSKSDGASYIELETGTEPVRGMYASDILTESGGITIKAALDSKVDKIQEKVILKTSRELTAADNGKLLIIDADGIVITMPANSEFNIDIAKMDEDYITIVQSVGTDKFREGTAAISVIRDVSITNTGITGKEWLAIGAYEA